MLTNQLLQDLSSLLPIGEKKKFLNQYLHNVQESEVNDILKECQAIQFSQLNLLTLLLADKFRRSDLIIELLYDGEKAILNEAVFKCWMYNGNGTNVGQLTNTEFLLNTFFPNVSYNCRQKVLNAIGRFAQNEQQVDVIWIAVEERYGFYAAIPLLQACTKGKMNSVISERKFDLVGYQLLQILQKYPDVGLEYLRQHYKRTIYGSGTYSYGKSLSHLFKNHPDEFLSLFLSHSDKMYRFKFGRCRSTYMIHTYRQQLLEQPKKFNFILRLNQIQKEFSTNEFQIFFESTLPDNPDYLDSCTMSKWVKKMPINKRLSMIRSAFFKLYQIQLDDHPEHMSPDYIILLPDEKRLSVIQWKYENDKNYSWFIDDLYLYFYSGEEQKFGWTPLKPISYSVPELQKLLHIEQDVGIRAALSKCLIVTCYVNEDLQQLLNVLMLLSKSSRNDQVEVRIEIFRAICNIMNGMEFTKEHWDVIIEMIQVSLIFKDSRDTSDSEKEKILDKIIEFHLKSQLPVNNIISMLVKVKIQKCSTTWTNSHIKNPADQRTLLELFVKELENFQTKRINNNSLSLETIANLIEEICKFNKSYVKPSNGIEPILIASHQWLRNSLINIVKEEEKLIGENWIRSKRGSWYFAKQLFSIVQTLTNEQQLSQDTLKNVESLLSTILLTSPSKAIFSYFLRKNPSVLNQHWSSILSKMLKSESNLHFIGKLKSSNYATLVAQSIKICLKIVNRQEEDSSEIHQKCNAVLVLSILSEPVDFLSLAAQFYPLETNLDVFAENSDEDYQIRQTFSKSLVNVTNPHLALPGIEKFCVGDYFKFVIGSLYSQADYALESKSISFLRQQIFNTRASLQKHLIRHLFKICSVNDKICFLKEMNSSSNVSIRHEIFLQASQLFRSIWSKEAWSILKSTIGNICQDDASTTTTIKYLNLFPNFDACAPEFLSEYIQACLTVLRKREAKNMQNFMMHMENIIDKIDEKTLDEILLHKYEEQVSFDYSFVVKYLLHSSTVSILTKRLSKVWLLLQNVIRNGWDIATHTQHDPNGLSDYPTKTSIFTFITTLCIHTHLNDLSKLWIEKQILQTFLEDFKAEFMTKLFKEILYMELSLLLLEESDKIGIEKLKAFGRRLGQFTDTLVKTYGGEIISIVDDTVQIFIENCCDKAVSHRNGVCVMVIDGILEGSQSRHNQMTSISLLQKVNPKASNLKETFERIKTKLRKSNDVVVGIYYDSANIK